MEKIQIKILEMKIETLGKNTFPPKEEIECCRKK